MEGCTQLQQRENVCQAAQHNYRITVTLSLHNSAICMGYKMIGHNSIKLTEFKLHGTYGINYTSEAYTQLINIIIVEIFMY